MHAPGPTLLCCWLLLLPVAPEIPAQALSLAMCMRGCSKAVIAAVGAHVAHTVHGGPQAGIRAEALQSNLSRRAAPGAVCHTGSRSNRLCRLGRWGQSRRAC
jgi:hypothetical protein